LKRVLDLTVSFFGLLIAMPIVVIFCFLIWLQDFKNPFYIPLRVGRNGKAFKMIKLRSMVVNADLTGVDSTSNDDNRITFVGRLIRKLKLDELTQLINVFIGDMSLVGPRPNIKRETDLYTKVEQDLLSVKPGITDFSSIIFADEGAILEDKEDPDISYHQLIRPWKSRLGLFYIEKETFFLDIQLIILTVLSIFSREKALIGVSNLLEKNQAPNNLIEVAKRHNQLEPLAPPGSNLIVSSREII